MFYLFSGRSERPTIAQKWRGVTTRPTTLVFAQQFAGCSYYTLTLAHEIDLGVDKSVVPRKKLNEPGGRAMRVFRVDELIRVSVAGQRARD